jgi:membrane protein DedA with SNARE-associated domain
MTYEQAASFLSVWGYPAYLVLFLLAAFGSPLTEDVLLLIGGYLIGAGVFRWPLALPVSVVGVVSTDLLMYWLGRKIRRHSLRRGLVRRFVRPGRLRAATRWFARFGDRVIFLARLVPGTRLVVFVSAGVRGMPIARFVAYDAAACLIWAPALLAIGAVLGERIGGISSVLKWLGDHVLWFVLGTVAVVLLRQLWLARAPAVPEENGGAE